MPENHPTKSMDHPNITLKLFERILASRRQDFKGSDSEGEKGADETLTKLGGLEVRIWTIWTSFLLDWREGCDWCWKMYENICGE